MTSISNPNTLSDSTIPRRPRLRAQPRRPRHFQSTRSIDAGFSQCSRRLTIPFTASTITRFWRHCAPCARDGCRLILQTRGRWNECPVIHAWSSAGEVNEKLKLNMHQARNRRPRSRISCCCCGRPTTASNGTVPAFHCLPLLRSAAGMEAKEVVLLRHFVMDQMYALLVRPSFACEGLSLERCVITTLRLTPRPWMPAHLAETVVTPVSYGPGMRITWSKHNYCTA